MESEETSPRGRVNGNGSADRPAPSAPPSLPDDDALDAFSDAVGAAWDASIEERRANVGEFQRIETHIQNHASSETLQAVTDELLLFKFHDPRDLLKLVRDIADRQGEKFPHLVLPRKRSRA